MTHSLGITVFPEWIQAEGTETVLANLWRAGATAVATSPYVMAESDSPNAGREPPIDAGSGKVRLLDRELWGKRELRCTTAPSFVPDKSLYQGLRYQPSVPTELTYSEGPKIGHFLERAKSSGFQVQLQVQAAIPPGYRVQFGGPLPDDQPRLPDGRSHENRIDKNGSLASSAIIDYGRALVKDVARAYPMIDCLRIDWPEYPPYTLLSWFFDFSSQAVGAARIKGYDIEQIRRDCLTLLHQPSLFLDEGLFAREGFIQLQRFKADLAFDLVQSLRDALPPSMRLIAHAFPEPWCRLSGMDMARIGKVADELAVKLYTMHWPIMLADYRNSMIANGGNSAEIAGRIQQLFDTGSDRTDLHYPEPDEPHPAGEQAQIRKVQAAIDSGADIIPIAHTYGPETDVAKRARTAYIAGKNRVWLNRYGYLSDAKIEQLGALEASVQ